MSCQPEFTSFFGLCNVKPARQLVPGRSLHKAHRGILPWSENVSVTLACSNPKTEMAAIEDVNPDGMFGTSPNATYSSVTASTLRLMSNPGITTTAPLSAQWLTDSLIGARLYDAMQLTPYLSEFRNSNGPRNARSLSIFLVEAGLLSKYQADRALNGEASKLLIGPYVLVEPIGSGSLGTVFQATGRSDRKRYAVKLLPLRSLWNVHLAKKQVQVFATLPPHPSVVPFIDVDTAGGFHYMAWPFVLGQTLAAKVQADGPLPADPAVRLAAQIAEGLLLCHTHQVSHGLLKPSNILIGNDGQARMLDLGIGAILSENIADDESMLDTISTANAAISMLDYAAPETLNSPTLRTPAGDVYSFGCTLYFLLTGNMPFPDGNAVDKVLAHQTSTPRPIRTINADVPNWLEALTNQMMAKAETDRPSTADVLAALLAHEYKVPNPEDSHFLPRPAEEDESRTPWLLQLKPRDVSLAAQDTPMNERTDASVELEMPLSDPTDPLMGSSAEYAIPAAPPVRPATFVNLEQSQYKLRNVLKGNIGHDTTPELPAPVTYAPNADSILAVPSAVPAVEIPELPPFARSILRGFRKKLLFWKPHADLVLLSIFGPPRISPGDNVTLQVFAHLPEVLESVRTLSKVFLQNCEMLATGYVQMEVRHGQKLGLHLGVVNAGVDRSEAELTWRGQPQPRKFDLYVPWESPAGPSPTVLSAWLDRAQAGRIAFSLQILPRKA